MNSQDHFKLDKKQTSDFIAKARDIGDLVFGDFMVYVAVADGDATNAGLRAKEFAARGIGVCLDKQGDLPHPYEGILKKTIESESAEGKKMICRAYFDFSSLRPERILDVGFHIVQAKAAGLKLPGLTPLILSIVNEGQVQRELMPNYQVFLSELACDLKGLKAEDSEKISDLQRRAREILEEYKK